MESKKKLDESEGLWPEQLHGVFIFSFSILSAILWLMGFCFQYTSPIMHINVNINDSIECYMSYGHITQLHTHPPRKPILN